MQSRNPATAEIIAEYPEHSAAQIEERLQRADGAFQQWRRVSIGGRASLFKGLAGVFRRRGEELAKLMTAEVGKTIVASESEVEKCAAACDFFAENAEAFLSPRTIESDASSSYVRFDPLGPVLAIMPWNFPLWQVIRFAAPALMAGNVAVLKHAPNVPGCALAIERAFAEAGFPAGAFSALLISDNPAAQRLVDNPILRAVTLTGSERAGAAVAAAAGGRLKKTVMELGGSDAFIVLADADVEQAAAKAAEARCINNGQSCIAAKRFIVETAVADRFEKAIVSAMAAMKVGDPMDRATQIGPLARLDLLDALHGQVRTSIEQGAKLRLGGRRRSGKGFFYDPTVLTGVRPGMAAFDEETFGPVAAIIRAGDPENAVRLANQSRYGLGASIWTRDADRAQLLAGEIESGCVFINGIVKSDPRLPFGGIKNSGWGRELSQFGIYEFVNIKTIWIK
ncbi:MAG: NAD-dependent succinate-semialdehyde dehydrogenase [Tepidisphaeraceae bacterium]|jgi:succinate-semialdehyde dehydrogenase/glutarate-semialdehyde dehydrogenase